MRQGFESSVKMTNQREASPELRKEAVGLETLQRYISDTLDYVYTVRTFGNRRSLWIHQRGTEWDTMRDIQRRANQLNLKIVDVLKSPNKGQTMVEYFKGSVNCFGNTREKLEKDLAAVLENTVEGMEKLADYLDAVEKLAVTSLHVFTGGEEVVRLFLGIRLQRVEDIISAARLVCPLLLQFKRDAGVFFRPSLHNVAVFVAELDKYIHTAEKIFTRMEKRAIPANTGCPGKRHLIENNVIYSTTAGFRHKGLKQPLAQLADVLPEDAVKSIIFHVKQLSSIRMDPHFRLVYLFQEKPMSLFIDKFSELHPRMLQFLTAIEDHATQLDKMKMGATISSFAGSSMGAIGGVLTIVGLALAPVTAGVSAALTVGGVGLGFTKGVNTVITKGTQMFLDRRQKKGASEAQQNFLQDMNIIKGCLEEVTNQREETLGEHYIDVFKMVLLDMVVKTCGDAIDTCVDGLVSDVVEEVTPESEILEALLENLPILEALGLDIFSVYKDGLSLAKGGKSDLSEFLRARAKPLCTDLETWQRMHESLKEGMRDSERSQRILEQSLNLLMKNKENGGQSVPMEATQMSKCNCFIQ